MERFGSAKARLLLIALCCLAALGGAPARAAGGAFVVNERAYDTLQAAADALRDGDTLRVRPGTYLDQAAFLTRSNVTVRADKGRALFKLATVGGKASFVVSGNNTTFDGIEWDNIAVPDGNGAAIRLEGAGLTVRNFRMSRCQDGILTGNWPPGDPKFEQTVLLEDGVIEKCGGNGGQSHGIYVGLLKNLVVRRVHFSQGQEGHLLKTRSATLLVEDSTFVEGAASRSIDVTNGGSVTIRRSKFYQTDETDNSDIIGYGTETRGRTYYPVNEMHFDASNGVSDLRSPKGTLISFKLEPTLKRIGAYAALPGLPKPVAVAEKPKQKVVLRPERDAGGSVAASWWASLPKRTWVEVEGTKLQDNVPRVEDYGNTGFAAVMSAWSGAAWDAARGRMFLSGGGHEDSPDQRFFVLDTARLRWSASTPTRMSAADYQKAWKNYAAATGRPGERRFEVGHDGISDETVDRKRTAHHTYHDLAYIPELDAVLTPGSKHYWLWRPTTDAWEKRGKRKSYVPEISAVYDPVRKKSWHAGAFDNDYWTLYQYDPIVGAEDPQPYKLLTSNAPGIHFGAMAQCVAGRDWFMYNLRSQKAWVIDLDQIRGSTAVATPVAIDPAHNPLLEDPPPNTCIYSPKLKRIVFVTRGGKLQALDPASGRFEEIPVAGAPPEGRSFANGVFGRLQYWPKHDVLVLVTTVDENVRLLKLH